MCVRFILLESATQATDNRETMSKAPDIITSIDMSSSEMLWSRANGGIYVIVRPLPNIQKKLFGSVYLPFCPLLLVDAVGADNLSTSLSLLIMVHGISISIMAPVLGKCLHYLCLFSIAW
jgi:hypothetical protein